MTTASFPEMFVMLRLLFVDGDLDGEAGTFDDLGSTAGVGSDSNSCPKSCQQTEIVVRPGPVKLRRQRRRLFHHNKVEMKKCEEIEHKEACSYLIGFLFCLTMLSTLSYP
jgi:hypothetical protein